MGCSRGHQLVPDLALMVLSPRNLLRDGFPRTVASYKAESPSFQEPLGSQANRDVGHPRWRGPRQRIAHGHRQQCGEGQREGVAEAAKRGKDGGLGVMETSTIVSTK